MASSSSHSQAAGPQSAPTSFIRKWWAFLWRWAKRLLWAGVVCLIAVALPSWLMLWETRHQRSGIDDAAPPPVEVGVVLGTSPRLEDGRPNLHFEYRMDAAADLWKRGVIKKVLATGDGRGPYYDEIRSMRQALERRGVDPSAILTDPQGLRTLASMRRVRQRFDIHHCLVISDDWHIPRAIFLASRSGLVAYGVGCRVVPWRASVKSRSREWLARAKAFIDMYGAGGEYGAGIFASATH